MPRRPAKVTQADIARAIRAAKAAGACQVIVDGQGIIRIALMADDTPVEHTQNSMEVWTPSVALQNSLKNTENG